MIDLETLGARPGSVLLSLGAVKFDPLLGKLGEEFYRTIDLRSCFALGLKFDTDTLLWWMRQSEEARKEAFKGEHQIKAVLAEFASWFLSGGKFIWSHGSVFDVILMEEAYRLAKYDIPWKYSGIRDTRTLYDIAGVSPDRSVGLAHHALDDAKNQAVAVCQGYTVLGKAARVGMDIAHGADMTVVVKIDTLTNQVTDVDRF